jgi:hypothetical protein
MSLLALIAYKLIALSPPLSVNSFKNNEACNAGSYVLPYAIGDSYG